MAAGQPDEPATAHDPGRDGGSGDRWVAALVGAVVTVVTAFVPFSPLLGGGVAGYLLGGTDRDGLWVGALAGGIASIPILAIVGLVVLVVGFGVAFADGIAGPLVVVAALVGVVVAFVVGYTVVLSAVGGLVGAALAASRRERSAGTSAGNDG